MVHKVKNQVDFRSFLKSIWQRKWLMLSCIIGVLLVVIFLNQRTIPIYEARTTIVYERFTGAMNNNNDSRPLDKNVITNAIEEIKSYSLVEDVIKVLPPEVLESFPLPERRPAPFDRDKYLITYILRNLQVENVTNSDVIEIRTRANTAKTAMVLAQTITEVLKTRNVKLRQATISNVRELIENQLGFYETRLKATEEALRNYKEQGGITYIDQESVEILKRITEAEVLYNKAFASRDAAQKRLKFIQDKLAQERKDLLPLITATSSPMVKRLKEELIDLEVQYTKLKVQNYGDDHPKMVALKSQIDMTRQRLTDETLKITRGEENLDPLSQIQRLMQDLFDTEIEVQTFQSQENALQQIIKEYQYDLKSVPEKELMIARLLRDKDVDHKIYTLLTEKREEARINEAEKFGNIRVLDSPQLPQRPIWPDKALNLVLGLLFGLMLSVGVVTVLELTDKRLKTLAAIKNASDIQVLGSIPKLNFDTNGLSGSERRRATDGNITLSPELIANQTEATAMSESFRTLRVNLQFSGLGDTTRSLLLTSSFPGEGKSMIAANLGVSLATINLKTLLVDADLRKPRLGQIFNAASGPGLAELLQRLSEPEVFATKSKSTSGGHPKNDAIRSEKLILDESQMIERVLDFVKREKVIQPTQIQGLDLLPAGNPTPGVIDLLVSPVLNPIITALTKVYDVVLFDTPPLQVVLDASVLGKMVDGVVLVVKAGVNTEESLTLVRETLERTHAKILGLITNYTHVNPNYAQYYSQSRS